VVGLKGIAALLATRRLFTAGPKQKQPRSRSELLSRASEKITNRRHTVYAYDGVRINLL
jgi:hypothetical protein